jgi:hypothetical protein
MTKRQYKALYELNRHLAFHNDTPQRKELLENIDAILRSDNGARAYKLIEDWYAQSEEYLLSHATEY